MKKKEPILVAIHCLVYNHEPFLRDCFDGFVMQKTNFRFVAIVHEDCSTDHSANIIREYTQRYPDMFIPIFETENQWGKHDGSLESIVSNAIDAIGSKYVAMCEGDDFWTDPYKLQKQVDFLEAQPEVGLCYTDFDVCDEGGNIIRKSCFFNKLSAQPKSFEDHLLNAGYIAPMTWVYRTAFLKILNESKVYTDGTFAYALEFYKQSKVAYLPYTTATYRTHVGSASNPNSVAEFFLQHKGIFDTQLFYAEKYNVSQILIDNIKSMNYFKLLPYAVKIGNQKFVEEVESFFTSKNLHFPTYMLLVNQLIAQQEEICHITLDYNIIANSKAYKIGTLLLSPLKFGQKLLYSYVK